MTKFAARQMSKIERAECKLIDLAGRLAPCRALDECNALLHELRKVKARIQDTKAAQREASAS
jgi:hypothetical protein